MDTRPRVICGFPGVGKSTLFNKLAGQNFPILDSDSSKFDKAAFPANYIAHIQQALEQGFWVLCSTHTAVREALAEAGIHYAIAAPAHKYQKAEYMARYRERGSPEGFLKLMDEKWDEFMDDVWIKDQHGIHIGLGEGEYLERITRDIQKSELWMKQETFKSTSHVIHDLTLGHPDVSLEFLDGMMLGTMLPVLTDMADSRRKPEVTFLIRSGHDRALQKIAMALQLDLQVTKTMNPHTQRAKFTLREEGAVLDKRTVMA